MGLAYTSKNKTWDKSLQQDNTQEYNYYVAVFAYNEDLYVDSDWYTWPILWRKTEVSPLKSYESAVRLVGEVVEYARQLDLPWQIKIQRELK